MGKGLRGCVREERGDEEGKGLIKSIVLKSHKEI